MWHFAKLKMKKMLQILAIVFLITAASASTVKECCHESLFATAGEIRKRYRIFDDCGGEMVCVQHCVSQMPITNNGLNIKLIVDTNLVNKIEVQKIVNETNRLEIRIGNVTDETTLSRKSLSHGIQNFTSTTTTTTRSTSSVPPHTTLPTTTIFVAKPSKSPCPCVVSSDVESTKAAAPSSTSSTTTLPSSTTTVCHCAKRRKVTTEPTKIKIRMSSVYESLAETTPSNDDESTENCTDTTTISP